MKTISLENLLNARGWTKIHRLEDGDNIIRYEKYNADNTHDTIFLCPIGLEHYCFDRDEIAVSYIFLALPTLALIVEEIKGLA